MSAKKFVFIYIIALIPSIAFLVYDIINGNTLLAVFMALCIGFYIGIEISTYQMKKHTEKMLIELEAARKLSNDFHKSIRTILEQETP